MQNFNLKFILTLAVVSFCLWSCQSNNDQKANDGKDSLAVDTLGIDASDNEAKAEDSTLIFTSQTFAFKNDLQHHQIDWSKLKLSNFGKLVDSTQTWRAYHKDASYYKSFASSLVWSPDHKLILDLGADNMVKDDNGDVVGGDPETEVALINPNANQRKQLMYLGASAEILSAKWLSNKEVAILGSFPTKNPNVNDTSLHIIDIDNNYVRDYIYNK